VLVFIDDSGDPGFKLDRGSSSHFVIACIVFDDHLDAEETALKIKRLRQGLGWKEFREFKFNKCSRVIRRQFFEEIQSCQFRVRAISINKAVIRSQELRVDRQSFYNYAIKEVLAHSDGKIRDAKIRLDGHGDRTYKRQAQTYFKKQLNARHSVVRDIKFVDSKGDSLIQLADMVAGAVFRSEQTHKPDSQDYLRILSPRLEDIWKFQ
jgi:hypothetical protein